MVKLNYTAKLICLGKDIGYTILPYSLDTPIEKELFNHPSDYVLGYVTYNSQTGQRNFTYTETGALTAVNDHWSLAILNEFPYCGQNGPWIVYNCPPEKARLEFGKILTGENLHIYNWDTWSLESKDSKIVVVSSWEIF
jgi:hypothetical protein